MAQRRMFSNTIIDSDKYLDMPLSAQALYFHLIMGADDDGFLNNPQKITRMIGASKEDYKLLIQSDFIIEFENGICAVKHWKMHNSIRADRYKPTVYQEELSRLTIGSNKIYEFSEEVKEEVKIQAVINEPCDTSTEENIIYAEENPRYIEDEFYSEAAITLDEETCGIPSGDKAETQVRLSKVSIGKSRLGEVSIDKSKIGKSNLDKLSEECVDRIAEKWNSLGISRISSIKNTRLKMLKSRVNENGIDQVIKAIENIEKSTFLRGQNDRGWIITFDWFIKPNNFIKVLEGNYDDKKVVKIGRNNSNNGSKKLAFNDFEQRDYDYDDLEKKLLGWA